MEESSFLREKALAKEKKDAVTQCFLACLITFVTLHTILPSLMIDLRSCVRLGAHTESDLTKSVH